MLLIGTPAYGCMVHQDWHNSIMALAATGFQFKTMIIGNESLITRGRNKIISYFNHYKEFDNLLFLDADVAIEPESIIKLIQHEKDVISAGVALKGFIDDKPVLNFDPIETQVKNLIKVKKAGTAVYMLSRKAVEALISISEYYGDIDMNRGVDIQEVPQYDVFKVGVFDNEYLPEDYYITRKLIELGYDVYVDTTIKTVHNGNAPFLNWVE